MKEFFENETLKPFFKVPTPGEIVKGKVIGRKKSALFLALSNFGTGVVTKKELSEAKDVLSNLKEGDEVSAKVVDIDTKDGFVELSIAKAKEEAAWLELKEKKEKEESFEVVISKANKGGLITEINGIVGFLPVSQLAPEHYPKVENGNQAEILRRLQKFIGKKLRVKIINLNQKQKSLILSEKAALLENKAEILKKYKVGDVVEGEITSISDFGAFIKFPLDDPSGKETLEGLIHISELDWQLVQHPSEIVKVGEKVKAKIVEIANGKISLSLKALKKDPWQDLKYKEGEVVEGKVIRFSPFGALVEIKPKIQGLIHISEFESEKAMKEILEINKKYKFQISFFSPKDHKMILKLTKNKL